MFRMPLLLFLPVVAFAQPSPVTIISPSDGTAGLTIPVVFVWTTSPQALAYTIQVATDSLFSSTAVIQSIAETTYVATSLQTSTRYYWRVRAEDVGGPSGWTHAMLTTKLNIPSLSNPASGAVDVSLTPTTRWSSVLPSAWYTVQLSLQSDFASIARSVETPDTSVELDTLSRATTYYWRVRAYIKGDTTTYSNSSFFTTIPDIPATPNLLVPADVSTNNAVNVVLRWSRVQNTTSYNLQVSTSPVFSTIFKDSSFADTLYRPKPFFNPNTQYYWHVRSVNNGGASDFSVTYRFATGTDTNKAKLSFQNLDIGTVSAGSVVDTIVTLSNAGNDDLLISGISNPQRWTAVNPGVTSAVDAFAVSGTNLFAGTWGAGIYLSTNNGTNWTPVNSGLARGYVSSLALSGMNLFAGTGYDGVFLSTNSGMSWTAASTGLTNASVHALAVSGTNLFAGTEGGVFLSTNNGANWTAANSGMTGQTVLSLAVSPASDGAGGANLFAGTYRSGVFRSTNNGETWTTVNSGLTKSWISALAVSDTNLFAGTWGAGIFLSTNNGTNWTAVNSGLTTIFVSSLAVSGKNLFAGSSYDGVFLSTNNGSSWTAVNSGLTNTQVCALAVSDTNLFAGNEGGRIFRSHYINVTVESFPSVISPNTLDTVFVHFGSIPNGAINLKLIIVSNASSSPDTLTITGNGTNTSVENTFSETPSQFRLLQNFPNPFNPSTTIRYGLPTKSHVTLIVYSTLGQQVAILVQGNQEAGYHEVQFDASRLASGVYFCRLTAGSFVQTRKLLLLR